MEPSCFPRALGPKNGHALRLHHLDGVHTLLGAPLGAKLADIRDIRRRPVDALDTTGNGERGSWLTIAPSRLPHHEGVHAPLASTLPRNEYLREDPHRQDLSYILDYNIRSSPRSTWSSACAATRRYSWRPSPSRYRQHGQGGRYETAAHSPATPS